MSRIYDSSLITQRRRDKTISDSFINRLQNLTTGSAPLLGISEQSIINTVKSGNIQLYTKNESGRTLIDTGCPCAAIGSISPIAQIISQGWATSIQTAGDVNIKSITSDSNNNIYVTGSYNSAITINSFSSESGGIINVIPYGTLANVGSDDIFIAKYNTNGIVQWVTRIGGSNTDDDSFITSDSNGNIYVTGSYQSTPVTINSFGFVSGGSVTVLPFGTLSNVGTKDIFVVKYNPNGVAQWATRIGGVSDDSSLDIVTDSANNIYVCGSYSSSPVTINSFGFVSGGSITVNPFGTLANVGSTDGFIAKYNTNGIVQWVTRVGGSSGDDMNGITTDSNNNIYVTGSYFSSPVTINSVGTVSVGVINVTPYGTLANVGDDDIFIVKYNTNGIVQWATRIGGTNFENSFRIITDNSDNLYISGYYESTPISINSFGSVSGGIINVTSYGTLANVGTTNIFIAKYNTNGIVQWVTRIGGSLDDTTIGITSDSLGNIYISGLYESSPITINSVGSVSAGVINVIPYGTLANVGNYDGLIVKYNTNGVAQWATRIGGISLDAVFGITTDSNNNVYVGGTYQSPTLTINRFDSVSGGVINVTPYATLTNIGGLNSFIVKYSTNGQIV